MNKIILVVVALVIALFVLTYQSPEPVEHTSPSSLRMDAVSTGKTINPIYTVDGKQLQGNE